jgi:hypothetical protein
LFIYTNPYSRESDFKRVVFPEPGMPMAIRASVMQL